MHAWTVERVASTGSTQDDVRAKARAGGPDRYALVAGTMTGGRGTNGRSWSAPAGGLYTSFVLRAPHFDDPHLVTLALGNAVADVLEVAGVEPRLKWVNDVWVEGRKIAGILVEGEATGDRFDFLVCGIGINVNGRRAGLGPAVSGLATTLEEELACEACIPDLETFLWQAIDKWLDVVASGRGQEVVAAFTQRDALQGRKVKVNAPGAGAGQGKALEGVAKGIDSRGRLLVDTGHVLETVQSGTVTLA